MIDRYAMETEATFSHLVAAEISDLGLRRRRNEDAIICIPDSGVFCVADGIGGAEVGQEASSLTVNMLYNEFQRTHSHPESSGLEYRKMLVRDAMNKSCRAIQDYCIKNSYRASGTTAVTMVFDKQDRSRAVVMHAGDSRAYRIRNHSIRRLTCDHTMEVENMFPDDNAWRFGMRTIITRAVGVRPFVDMDETEVDVMPGDVFLLCSDGLTRMLDDKTISDLIKKQGIHDLDTTIQKLVSEANYAGGQDNISILLVRVDDHNFALTGGGDQESVWDSMMRSFGRWIPGR